METSNRLIRSYGNWWETVAAIVLSVMAMFFILGTTSASASTSTGRLGGFPRTTYFQPTWTEMDSSLSSITRYDSVITMSEVIASRIKAVNPVIMISPYPNAREVSVGEGSPERMLLDGASTKWMLTQVGTTLSAGVSGMATSFPVVSATADGIRCFKAGEWVLIEEELAQIADTYDGTSLTLPVLRGRIPAHPAAAHPAGVRIAAVCSGYPTAILMDVTTRCPAVDVGFGPETWTQYNIRILAVQVAAPMWDEVYVDCADFGLVKIMNYGGASMRSIDWSRSNRIPSTAEYESLDADWNAGILDFYAKLRTAVGSSKPIVGNGAAADYANLNGALFEDSFTGLTSPRLWHNQAIESGGFNGLWSPLVPWNGARKPAASMVMLSYDWQPSDGYAIARYDLCTALLGSASLAFVQEHHPLLWLDEFDNAGTGRGYLGQPVGNPYSVNSINADLMAGAGAFNSLADYTSWSLHTSGSVARSSSAYEGGAFRATVTMPDKDWSVALSHPLNYIAGRTYRISFRAKASSGYTLSARLGNSTVSAYPGEPWNSGDLTPEWKDFSYYITAATTGSGLVEFYFGEIPISIWLDDVQVRETNPEVWRRDFDNGISIVNAEAAPQTVELGGTFRKINGTQDHTVNDGSLVTRVTLQPRDGIILLKTATPATAPDFPRIATWWPNTSSESLADIAGNDSVVLPWQQDSYISGLRTANPDVMIPNYVNACELFLAEAKPTAAQWLVTQVGSRLTSAVTAAATVLPVTAGDGTLHFAVDDYVVVGSELMKITAVSANSLTVQRGAVWDATVHAVGDRIASCAQTWPGALLYDVSVNCPLVDVGFGPERWTDWNARLAISRARAAGRDALVLDRLDGYEYGRDVLLGLVRNMDPDRSNRVLTTSSDFDTVYAAYSVFDAQWNAGLATWASALRTDLGVDYPIAANAPASSVRNIISGATFEVSAVDGSWGGNSWTDWAVGSTFASPRTRYSYVSWDRADSTQFSNIIWYDDFTGSANAFATPFNYRRMRFGLATALMGNGYFCYAVNSGGISGLGMSHFDEYDNAGAGRGYLGQPTGSATPVGNAYRRDYENGIVLVNPTAVAVMVQLGGTFRKIRGTQTPAVNDGSSVTQITLPAHDGIILLNTSGGEALPTSIRFSSTAITTLAYGAVFKIAGTLSSSGVGLVGQTMILQSALVGKSFTDTTGHAVTDASGRFAFIVKPTANTSYRVRFVGNEHYLASEAPTSVSVLMHSYVSKPNAPAVISHSHHYTVTGFLKPRYTAGTHPVRIYRYKLVAGHWRSYGYTSAKVANCSSYSKYSVSLHLSSHGKWRIRAYVVNDGKHVGTWSGYDYVTVR